MNKLMKTMQTTAQNENGFWDMPDGSRSVSRGENQRYDGDMKASLSHGEQVNSGRGKMDDVGNDSHPMKQEDKSEIDYAEEGKEEEVDSDDDDNDDDDDDKEEENKEKALEEEEQKTTKDHDPILSRQAEQVKLMLSLSPGRQQTFPIQKTNNNGAKDTGKTLSNNYLSSRGMIPLNETGSVAKSGSRLYSKVLKDQGFIRTGRVKVDTLNIGSPTQFPELDYKTQEIPQRRHSGHSSQTRDPHSPSSSKDWSPMVSNPVTHVGVDNFDETAENPGRSTGAVPKRPTLHSNYSNYSKEAVAPLPYMATESESIGQRSGVTRPPIGRGRAKTLACHEDMLRNIRRPLVSFCSTFCEYLYSHFQLPKGSIHHCKKLSLCKNSQHEKNVRRILVLVH